MIDKIITWFDGKKTSIGAVLFFLAALITKIVSAYEITVGWITPTIEIIEYVAMTLTTVGLGHKAIKGKPETPTNTPQ